MAKTDTENNENKKTKKSVCCVPCCRSKNKQLDAKNAPIVPKPKVPYSKELPNNLKTGTTIAVSGLIEESCSRFSVNLICGRGPDADIALHVNPRLAQRYVVRNCRLNGHWGDEETTSIVKFDLSRNKKFDLAIFIAEKEFLVSLNGKHICAFGYRVPLSKITAVEVQGHVEVYGVEYKDLKVYPEITEFSTPLTVPTAVSQNELSSHFMDTPLTGLLSRGFQQGWQIEIYGRVKILPHSFYINLQEGSQIWPHPIIPLHLNPRFSAKVGGNLFVRNAWMDNCWGKEERASGFPFTPGQPFRLVIRREVNHFSVWVDGQLCGEFKFRGPVDKIDAVYIHGDVRVMTLHLSETNTELRFNDLLSNNKL